jgi:hypothetical protein
VTRDLQVLFAAGCDDVDAGVGEGEVVGLELLDDLDPGARAEREDRLQRGTDRVAAGDVAPLGRDDGRRLLLVELDERVEIARVERRGDQRVYLLGTACGHRSPPALGRR